MRSDFIRQTLEGYYKDRIANDAALIVRHFAPDVRYVMAGAAAESPVISTDVGPTKFADIAETLVDAWRWREVDISALVVEGDKAAVRFRLVVEFAPTGEKVETELANFWTFRDGRCVEMVEFVDTALMRRMTA